MLACCLYLMFGMASMQHPPVAPNGTLWLWDRNEIVNPYGSAEFGWSYPVLSNLQLELAVRHLSSLGIDWRYQSFDRQYGENTAELRLRWYPWKRE